MLFLVFYISELKFEVTSHNLSHMWLLATILDTEDYRILLSVKKVLLDDTVLDRREIGETKRK